MKQHKLILNLILAIHWDNPQAVKIYQLSSHVSKIIVRIFKFGYTVYHVNITRFKNE